MALQDSIDIVDGLNASTKPDAALYQAIFGPLFAEVQACLDKVADFEALEAAGVSAALQNIADTIAPQIAGLQTNIGDLTTAISDAQDMLALLKAGGVDAENVVVDVDGITATDAAAALLELLAKIADVFTKAEADARYPSVTIIQSFSEAQKGQARANIGVPAGWNWIINGDFTVNQRGGTRTPGTGVYGYDRWKGHAGGLEQIIENLPAGDYTLTFDSASDGSGTFGGTTAVSPIYVTGLAGGETSVVVPSDATHVSVCAGDCRALADPYQYRPEALELALCKRYYQKTYPEGYYAGDIVYSGCFDIVACTGGSGSVARRASGGNWQQPVTMRPGGTSIGYSPNTGASGKCYSTGDGADVDANTFNGDENRIVFQVASATITASTRYYYHIVTDAEF